MKTIYLKSEFGTIYSKQTFIGYKQESLDINLYADYPAITKHPFLTCKTISMSECSRDEFMEAYKQALEMLKP